VGVHAQRCSTGGAALFSLAKCSKFDYVYGTNSACQDGTEWIMIRYKDANSELQYGWLQSGGQGIGGTVDYCPSGYCTTSR
jgi:hypothetical protein